MGIGRLILGSKKVYERILTIIVFTGAIVLLDPIGSLDILGILCLSVS